MVGKIVNRVPGLLKKAGKDHRDLMYECRLAYETAADWAEYDGRPAPKAVSQEVMAKLCYFFGVQPGEIWQFVPEKK